MPTDVSRSHDGEGQRSDEQYKPSSSSRKAFDLSRIRADRNYANSVQSSENRGKREYNPNTERSIDERGKFVENRISLATNYGQDNPGLKGGMESGESSDSNDLERVRNKYRELLASKEELEKALKNENLTDKYRNDVKKQLKDTIKMEKELAKLIYDLEKKGTKKGTYTKEMR